MSVYKEKVIYGEPPAGMVSVEDTARFLKIDKKNVCGTMRKYGYESCLYTTASTKRYSSIWMFRRELKRKFGVSITIRQCHEMLQNGTSFEGWFIDEEE